MLKSKEAPKVIAIIAFGSRGDTIPYCALGLKLQASGYQVRLIANENFAPLVTQLGLSFFPIQLNYQDFLRSEASYQIIEGKLTMPFDEDLFWQIMMDSWQACQGIDALIFTPLAAWGYHIAEKLNVPAFLAGVYPFSPTGAYPLMEFGRPWEKRPLFRKLNYLHYLLLEAIGWRLHAKSFNRFRVEVLGLKPIGLLGIRYRLQQPPYLAALPILYGCSPQLIERPTDWRKDIHICGNWILSERFDPPDDPELAQFLSSGNPPVCISLGSTTMRDPEAFSALLVEAIEITSARFLVQRGWANLPLALPAALHERVLVVEEIPHDWLFSHCAAVVHHGGAGVVAAACRAGLPSVVVSFFADQPAWGDRLYALGVSPPRLRYQHLTPAALASAIEQALGDLGMRQRAQALGQAIRREAGDHVAINLIESYLKKQKITLSPLNASLNV